MALNLALKCGLRKQEIMFLQFRDIIFDEKTLLVRGKPEYGFHVKDYEERYIPIPDGLLEDLRAWRTKYPERSLVVQTASGLPDRHLLAKLKQKSERQRSAAAPANTAGKEIRIVSTSTYISFGERISRQSFGRLTSNRPAICGPFEDRNHDALSAPCLCSEKLKRRSPKLIGPSPSTRACNPLSALL